jgi:putative thioredoxin
MLHAIDVNEANFEKEVLQRSRQTPVVLDFTATWCGPCQELGPVLEKLAAEYAGRFTLAKIDIDRSQYLAMELGVQSVPAVFGVRDGRIVGQFVGALPEAQVRGFIEQLFPSAGEITYKKALELAASEPAKALELVDELAAAEPRNEDLAAFRAGLLLTLGRYGEAKQAAEQVSEGSDRFADAQGILARLAFHEQAAAFGGLAACREAAAKEPADARARYRYGICLASEGEFAEALRELTAAAERDPALAQREAKEAMVRIFNLLGPESELADEYRGKLAALLY